MESSGQTGSAYQQAGILSEWLEDGLHIRGLGVSLPPAESMPLLWDWFDHFIGFLEEEGGDSDRAAVLATLKACNEMYGRLPTDEEMAQGNTVLGRKLDLLYAYTQLMRARAHERGVEFGSHLVKTRPGESPQREMQQFNRMLLKLLVIKVSGENPGLVEKTEKTLGPVFTNWEQVVSSIYDIDGGHIGEVINAVRDEAPGADINEIADQMVKSLAIACGGLDWY